MSAPIGASIKATVARPPVITPAPACLLQRKCACGSSSGMSGECDGCQKKRLSGETRTIVQTKLAISEPGDKYEREADEVADLVMHMPDAHLQPCAALSVQRASLGTDTQGEAPPVVQDVLRSPGRPLDASTRRFFESRFGHDFGRIRIHADDKAAESARSVKALAYTVGRDIVFEAGQYVPGTEIGMRLLAHELVHAVQQEKDTNAHSNMTVGSAPALQRQSKQTAPCVEPIRFRHHGARNLGANAIRVNLSWESSTGNLADLGDCTIREFATFLPIPDPPFKQFRATTPIIIKRTVPGTDGGARDSHLVGDLKHGISNPRQPGTALSIQVYQFRCTGEGCDGTWTTFPLELYQIKREVFGRFALSNPWRYKITKLGVLNGFNFSREVEIPPP